MLTGSCHSVPDLGATMRTETEATLIDRLRGGDTSALEGLMEQFAPRVYRLAYGITRNEADAEEVVQDVFLNLFRKIDGFEGRAALGTWIYRITVNAALIKRRGKRVEMEVFLEDHLPTFREDGHREGDRAMLLADWSETPEEELLSSETRRAVRRMIASLPDRYRVVLLLRDLEGLSSEETAEVLGDSVASVKSRLHRARMALREQVTRSFVLGSVPADRLASPRG
jgi:RNA polymerase sigma-70 factor (ECF subfamily)